MKHIWKPINIVSHEKVQYGLFCKGGHAVYCTWTIFAHWFHLCCLLGFIPSVALMTRLVTERSECLASSFNAVPQNIFIFVHVHLEPPVGTYPYKNQRNKGVHDPPAPALRPNPVHMSATFRRSGRWVWRFPDLPQTPYRLENGKKRQTDRVRNRNHPNENGTPPGTS